MIKNFKPSELIVTNSRLNNFPDDFTVWDNLCYVATCLQSIRNAFHGAIRVTSGYRSPKINAECNGSPTSAHLQGLAADIKAWNSLASDNNVLWSVVMSKIEALDIDQAICYTLDGTPDSAIKWIHVGWSKDEARHQILYKS